MIRDATARLRKGCVFTKENHIADERFPISSNENRRPEETSEESIIHTIKGPEARGTTRRLLIMDRRYPSLCRGIMFVLFFLGLPHRTCSIYPFPTWGSPYQTADHYWPMQNITNGVLEDVQGAAQTVVFNAAKIIPIAQLKSALSLDGKDDYVDTGGFNADCVTDPSRCLKGFSMSFWMRVHGSGFIMSSGSFTNHRNGPGFRLLYKSGNHGFEFVLETTTKRWDLHIQGDTNVWTHMAFTWREGTGLKYYEDGNLSIQTNRPKYISRSRNFTPVITLARPSNVFRVREFGHFDISHLALWTKDLSSSDLSGVYEKSVVYDGGSPVCCYFKSVNKCTTDPCSDVKKCKKDDSKCICPRVQLQLRTCQEKIVGECEDQISVCDLYAKQQGYCEQRRMREKCPKACSYCARLSNETSTTYQPTTRQSTSTKKESLKVTSGTRPRSTGTEPTKHEVEASSEPAIVSTSCPPENPGCSTQIVPTTNQRSTPRRHMPTGRSCEKLDCPFYARCVLQDGFAKCLCPRDCPLERERVCGDNGETYLNKCVLRAESCRLEQLIRKVSKGPCGPFYVLAVHYWPFNYTTKSRTLLDIRGNKPGMTYNGVRMTHAEQLGHVISLDGRDEWISLTKINGTHVENPALSKEGLSVAFWLKFYAGEFIMSSGRFADSSDGPGFRFICLKCRTNQPRSNRKFLLELSTQTEKWQISLDYLPEAWLHLAFTWKQQNGLKLYKNGKLLKTAEKSQSISRTLPADSQNSIILARPNFLWKLKSYGKFDIGHLVLWDSELSSYDIEVAFRTVLAKSVKSLICCFSRRDHPCMKDACLHDCENFEEKYDCICPDLTIPKCDRKLDTCADKISGCASLAKKGNCVDRKPYMLRQCPRTCRLCSVQESKITTLFSAKSTVSKYTTSSSPTLLPPTTHAVPASSSKAKKYSYSSTQAALRMAKSKARTLHVVHTTATSIHTSSARIVTSTQDVFTRKESISTPPLSSSTAPKDAPGGSSTITRLRSSQESPSSSTVFGSSAPISHQILSGSVFGVKSYLHDVITGSDVSTTVVSSKRLRLSSTGVASSPSALTTTTTTTATSPSATPKPTTKAPKIHYCNLGSSGDSCVCLNCQANQKCCTNSIPTTNLQQGIVVAIASINTDEFISKMDDIRKGLADVVVEACNDQRCVIEYEHSKHRLKRSARTSSSDPKSSKGAEVMSSRGVSVRVEELPPAVNSSTVKIVDAEVVIFDFAEKNARSSGLNASFYVKMASQRNRVNATGVLNGTVLFSILEQRSSAVESKLNLSITPISKWRRDTGRNWEPSLSTVAVQESVTTTAVSPDDTTTPTVEAQAQSSPRKMSQTTLILIITAGCLGFLALLVLAFYLGKYFSRKMNGEFVPGKIYDNSEDSSNPELLPSFIDPSTPRITDVPHKPVRAQNSRTQNSRNQSTANSTAASAGTPKKPKKPMGVKITYKPPKWD